jgi:hypothetical protein
MKIRGGRANAKELADRAEKKMQRNPRESVEEGLIGRSVRRAVGNAVDKHTIRKDNKARAKTYTAHYKARAQASAPVKPGWDKNIGHSHHGGEHDRVWKKHQDADTFAKNRSGPSEKSVKARQSLRVRKIRHDKEKRRNESVEIDEYDLLMQFGEAVSVDGEFTPSERASKAKAFTQRKDRIARRARSAAKVKANRPAPPQARKVRLAKIDRAAKAREKDQAKNAKPARRSIPGTMYRRGNEKFSTNEELDEAKMGVIARNVRKGESPYTIVAIEGKKVVATDYAKIPNQVPAIVRELKKEFPRAKIGVEDRSGKMLHTEDIEVAEGGRLDRSTKPSKELNLQKRSQKWVGRDRSLKPEKKAAHKAERSKSKKDIRNFKEFSEAKLRIPKETGTPGMTKARGPKTPYERAKAFIAAHQRDNKGKYPTQAQLDKAIKEAAAAENKSAPGYKYAAARLKKLGYDSKGKKISKRNQTEQTGARKPVVVARKAWNEEFSENEK